MAAYGGVSFESVNSIKSRKESKREEREHVLQQVKQINTLTSRLMIDSVRLRLEDLEELEAIFVFNRSVYITL